MTSENDHTGQETLANDVPGSNVNRTLPLLLHSVKARLSITIARL